MEPRESRYRCLWASESNREESSHVFVVCRHVPERPHVLPVIMSCDLIYLRN